MSDVHVNELIDHTINEIKKVINHPELVDVHFSKEPDKKIKTTIEVRARSNKFVASKIDSNLKKSLLKSRHAILKQFDRLKTAHKKSGRDHLIAA